MEPFGVRLKRGAYLTAHSFEVNHFLQNFYFISKPAVALLKAKTGYKTNI